MPFAAPDEPFVNPIVGIDLLDGGGFDFEDGPETATLQGGPHHDHELSPWVVRLVGGRLDQPVSVTPIDVLDRSGVIVSHDGDPNDEVVWLEGDFVYRLSAVRTPITLVVQPILMLLWLIAGLCFLIRGPRSLTIAAVGAIGVWIAIGPNLGVAIALSVALIGAWWAMTMRVAARGDEGYS